MIIYHIVWYIIYCTVLPDIIFSNKLYLIGMWCWGTGLCKWVLAMERYEEVDRKVAPKREALQRADQQYQGLMGELRKKQEALRGVQEELAGLQAELDTVKKEKLELEQTVGKLSSSTL